MGPCIEQHGRQAAGRGVEDTLDSWKLSKLLTNHSLLRHKAKIPEDVTKSRSSLKVGGRV